MVMGAWWMAVLLWQYVECYLQSYSPVNERKKVNNKKDQGIQHNWFHFTLKKHLEECE